MNSPCKNKDCNQNQRYKEKLFMQNILASKSITAILPWKPKISSIFNDRMQYFQPLNDLIFEGVLKPVLFSFEQGIFIIYNGLIKIPVIFIFKPLNKKFDRQILFLKKKGTDYRSY